MSETLLTALGVTAAIAYMVFHVGVVLRNRRRAKLADLVVAVGRAWTAVALSVVVFTAYLLIVVLFRHGRIAAGIWLLNTIMAVRFLRLVTRRRDQMARQAAEGWSS